MKKVGFILVAITLIICSGVLFAFRTTERTNAESPVVIIRTFQVFSGDASAVHIYYGNSKVEEIKLEKLRADTQHKNWDLILSTINKFYADGYHLVSSTERGENSVNYTFILSK